MSARTYARSVNSSNFSFENLKIWPAENKLKFLLLDDLT